MLDTEGSHYEYEYDSVGNLRVKTAKQKEVEDRSSDAIEILVSILSVMFVVVLTVILI
jgi:hypothetical protein